MSNKANRAPDFFILGGMKCGTTSLFNYLLQHPAILPPEEKELHYYDIHRYQGKTVSEYVQQFPEREQGQLSGEGTPFYLTHPHCPEWLQQDFPEARFIVVMRNPVERFWSHYCQFCRYRDYNGSPESLIEKELELLPALWEKQLANPEHPVDELKLYSLLLRGRYADQLANWFLYFAMERFLLLFTEDLLTQRHHVVNKALEFIGLEAQDDMQLDTLHHTQDYEPMPAGLEQWLRNYYTPHNNKLAELLNTELPWSR